MCRIPFDAGDGGGASQSSRKANRESRESNRGILDPIRLESQSGECHLYRCDVASARRDARAARTADSVAQPSLLCTDAHAVAWPRSLRMTTATGDRTYTTAYLSSQRFVAQS